MKISGDTRFFFELDLFEQLVIARALMVAGIEGDDYERAINSRVCDLEDTIGAWA